MMTFDRHRCSETRTQNPSVTIRRIVAGTFAILALGFPTPQTRAGDLDRAIEVVLKMNTAAAQSQKKVDKLDEQKSDLLSQYRSVQQQLSSVADYNAQVEKLVAQQQEQSDGLQRQIDDATSVGRGVTPLMLRMIESLAEFVELDVPFLLEERRERVMQLQKIMEQPNVTEAEKYRRITEAYQIENEYGRTIEAYRGEMSGSGGEAGSERTVEFLRVGRVALIYRTFDSAELGVWNQTERKWESLPAEYRNAIKEGFRIARKQAAPNLFRIPVPAPTEASK